MDQYQNSDQGADDSSSQADDTNGSSRFAEVKERAVKELLAILPETTEFSAERRFDIYMSAIRSSGDEKSAENALEAALLIEDQQLRANALSELIDEVEYLELKTT